MGGRAVGGVAADVHLTAEPALGSIQLAGSVKVVTPKRWDRVKARDFLLTNLLVLPGLGSVMAGRRVGYMQGLLALSGVVLTMVFAVDLVRGWWWMGELVLPTGRSLLVGGLGILLFAAGWCWGLATGLKLLRDADPADGGLGP
jgi:hypothetical protein